jgi:hypothetical protein
LKLPRTIPKTPSRKNTRQPQKNIKKEAHASITMVLKEEHALVARVLKEEHAYQ